jgi:hypothetical protein
MTDAEGVLGRRHLRATRVKEPLRTPDLSTRTLRWPGAPAESGRQAPHLSRAYMAMSAGPDGRINRRRRVPS